ncbi:MAG: stage V sporulation protein AD [Deltaproteobacteria bacterium]
MISKKISKNTVKFHNPPSIIQTASIVGPREGDGPLSRYFDEIISDELWNEKTWEKAESKILRECINNLVKKSNKPNSFIDYILAGDLLNQCLSSNYAVRDIEIPYFGLYGACSTMAESLSLAGMIIDGGFADNVICAASSHFCSAEKQFRFPLELGTQRPLTSQWTVTGAGATLLSSTGNGPYLTHITTGKVIDMGINDSNNMGAAMAPAAADTIYEHFNNTGIYPDDYDFIITGDLGYIGLEITSDILARMGLNITDKLLDCGVMIFDRKRQDVHAGGSGCGCSATVFNGYIYKELLAGNFKNILLVATGALMNPTSIQQGETIPAIAHAVAIRCTK